jgi:2'-5' RNA ligase
MFVAWVPDDDQRRNLQQSCRSLIASLGEHGRALPECNYHLTMVFLGDLPPSSVDLVKTALARVATMSGPLPIKLDGIGLFPGCRKPRFLVAQVAPDAGLLEMHDSCLAHLHRAGLGIAVGDGNYRPHISLARVVKLAGVAAEQWQQGHSATCDERLQVDALTLVQSEPQASAASIYTPIATFRLGSGQSTEKQFND